MFSFLFFILVMFTDSLVRLYVAHIRPDSLLGVDDVDESCIFVDLETVNLKPSCFFINHIYFPFNLNNELEDFIPLPFRFGQSNLSSCLYCTLQSAFFQYLLNPKTFYLVFGKLRNFINSSMEPYSITLIRFIGCLLRIAAFILNIV